MPDHVHFIICKAGDHAGSTLREIVGWFKTMTTNEYIKRSRRKNSNHFAKKYGNGDIMNISYETKRIIGSRQNILEIIYTNNRCYARGITV